MWGRLFIWSLVNPISLQSRPGGGTERSNSWWLQREGIDVNVRGEQSRSGLLVGLAGGQNYVLLPPHCYIISSRENTPQPSAWQHKWRVGSFVSLSQAIRPHTRQNRKNNLKEIFSDKKQFSFVLFACFWLVFLLLNSGGGNVCSYWSSFKWLPVSSLVPQIEKNPYQSSMSSVRCSWRNSPEWHLSISKQTTTKYWPFLLRSHIFHQMSYKLFLNAAIWQL